jgi:dTDP-4-amino-4,6-dideoxygalactose transaminase
LGVSQIDRIEQIIAMRRQKAQRYHDELKDLDEVILPTDPSDARHVYQLFTLRLKNKGTRDRFQQHLMNHGIMSKVYFHPIHLKSFYKKRFGYKQGDLPMTEELAATVLTIPLYPTMTEADQGYIIKQIIDFFHAE